MPSSSTPLPEVRESVRKLNDQGFSLLEVIVALAIMAIGYVTVLNLFSGSIKSVGLSDQYMKAVTLANSKLSELEMLNFEGGSTSGTFKSDRDYRWDAAIEPYDSGLNDEEANIHLSKVTLKVSWADNQKPRDVELTTLLLDGTAFPASDAQLLNIFKGGATSLAEDQAVDPNPPSSDNQSPDSGSSSPSPRVSGAGSGSISGAAQSSNISGS